ncbi:MAG: type III-B CRISPR module RAMP protein Cmr1 [Pseudanabaenaceae cyanobacterium bins.39]|nr:type III-B CRISPR module RAMP protein Cmr1 [Pseudanabaenaceae cyanobacterium bins.39]
MPSITFDLETVTPLFLSGADQTIAELRPPAFRGALRYWFRALVGGCFLDQISQLQTLESELFGDSGNKGVSKVSIRLKNYNPNPLSQSLEMTQDIQRRKRGSGVGYLMFSMGMQRRKAIGVNNPEKFSLVFQSRPDPIAGNQTVRDRLLTVASVFWFAVNLGNFGSRVKRGAGGICVRKVTYDNTFSEEDKNKMPRFPLVSPDNLSGFYRKESKKALSVIRQNLNLPDLPPKLNQYPDFDVFAGATFKASYLKDGFDTAYEAMDEIGKLYAKYRSTINPTRRRAIFGLPLKKVEDDLRRSSPLQFKVVKSGAEYFCIVIRLYAKFPSSHKLKVSLKDDYPLLNEFVETLPNTERLL